MRSFRRIAFLAIALQATVSFAQQLPQKNPLLIHSNAPIQFKRVDANVIRDAAGTVLNISNERIKTIIAAKGSAKTLLALDELQYDIVDLSAKLGLIASTYQDDSTRNSANEESGNLSLYATNLFLNEDLYKAVKAYAASPAAKAISANHKKFLRETLIAFEKNGMKLDAIKRKDLQALNEKLVYYGIQFDKNIAESKDSITFTEAELSGVADNTKKPWKRANGSYVVYVNGPNATEIASNADNPETRHIMYLRYNNRAYPKNITTLDSLFFYRNQFAKLLGFKSYAAYSVVDKMAGSPAKVWAFENDLITKLKPHVTAELNELKQIKRELNPDLPNELLAWDLSYYRKKLLDKKYQLNTDEVKEYFEMNNTLKGMFSVYEKLFAVRIMEKQNLPVWHEKVRSFEMYKAGKKIGNFYLDLYPRPNKYTHFACFPISQYRIAAGKEVVPVSALICNFPEGSTTQPSLLYHSDVVTMFHEFGHLVHSMLGRSDIASQGPFSVKGDFTEAPSQFLENWVWEYEPLKMFAKHYQTGNVLPLSLYNKMTQTRKVGVASHYIRQAYLGILDFTYEDKYDSIRGRNIVEVSKDLNTITQVPFAEGSHFIASFTHLNGYAANYYGYLWSKVFAEDMFSVFKKNGVMDTNTGVKYRREILEKASTKEEIDMLRAFLGRAPNSNAFLLSLGINKK